MVVVVLYSCSFFKYANYFIKIDILEYACGLQCHVHTTGEVYISKSVTCMYSFIYHFRLTKLMSA